MVTCLERVVGGRAVKPSLGCAWHLAFLLLVPCACVSSTADADLSDAPGTDDVTAVRVESSRSSGDNGVVVGDARQRLQWVEDESGLRQVSHVNLEDVEQWEILLGDDGQGLSKSTATGAILGSYQSNLAAKWALMQAIGARVGADVHQARSRIGPVALVANHMSVDAIVLNARMSVALAAGGVIDRCMGLGYGAGRRDVAGANIVAKIYDSALQAAARVREVMFDKNRRRSRALIGDSVKTLETLTREASGWLEAVFGASGMQSRGNSWRDMAWEGVDGKGDLTMGRTRVLENGEVVEIVFLEARHGKADVPGVYREMSMVSLRREDLHGADISVMEQHGRLCIKVSMQSRVMKTWLTVPPPDGNELSLGVIGDSAIRASAVKQVLIWCDAQKNAADLALVLRKFVG